jgi:hypothetical protein
MATKGISRNGYFLSHLPVQAYTLGLCKKLRDEYLMLCPL